MGKAPSQSSSPQSVFLPSDDLEYRSNVNTIDSIIHNDFLRVDVATRSIHGLITTPMPEQMCWHDCHPLPVDKPPRPYPIHGSARNITGGYGAELRTVSVRGMFCDWACMITHNDIHGGEHRDTRLELIELLALVIDNLDLRRLGPGNRPRAMPREMLTVFGGEFSILQFRAHNQSMLERARTALVDCARPPLFPFERIETSSVFRISPLAVAYASHIHSLFVLVNDAPTRAEVYMPRELITRYARLRDLPSISAVRRRVRSVPCPEGVIRAETYKRRRTEQRKSFFIRSQTIINGTGDKGPDPKES